MGHGVRPGTHSSPTGLSPGASRLGVARTVHSQLRDLLVCPDKDAEPGMLSIDMSIQHRSSRLPRNV